jgi:hypothetical protein
MRVAIPITIVTLMVTCIAPAFAEGEGVLSSEPVIAEQVQQGPLELASEPIFEIASQAGAPTCVVYTTQSSSPESGFRPPCSALVGAAPPPEVPEPGSMLALMTGIGGILLRPWKRR